MEKEWPDARVHSKYHDQFVTLNREHAQIVLEDTFVYTLFEKHCSAMRERCASFHALPCIQPYVVTLPGCQHAKVSGSVCCTPQAGA